MQNQYQRNDRRRPGERRFQPAPAGPSASLLAHPLVRGARGAGPSLGDAILVGMPILYPEIAAERLEALADAQFAGKELTALAAALAAELAERPGISAAELRCALERSGHAPEITVILEKLRGAGLSALASAGAEHAAAVFDDAAHLRLRAGALSIERQAAATALGREASDVHLSRLRDILEQDQRSLRPDRHDETEGAGIVHPFKRR